MCTCSGTIYETVPDENCVEQCYNLMLVKRVLPIRLLLKDMSCYTKLNLQNGPLLQLMLLNIWWPFFN